MSTSLKFVLLVALGLVLVGPCSAQTALPRLSPGESMPATELEAFVDGSVRAGMDQAHVAGVAVAVVQDGRVVFEKGYGFAAFDPPRAVDAGTTLFRIGSITKTFTWIAAMKAVEAGKIDLDRPINTYLPAALQIPDENFKQQMRMRDLMTHSPGFEDRVLGILFVDKPERVLPLNEFLHRYRPRRVREPGALPSYSNYGAALAGAAVANVEGMSWEDVIEREILTPLKLSHISVREPHPPLEGLPAPMSEALAHDLSRGFRWNGVGHTARDFEYITQIAPAGVMSASASDMARYMLMLLNDGALDGTTIFGPVAARAFRTPMTTLPGEVGAMDAGFFESPAPGGFRSYGHGGGTLSFLTNMTLVPELRLGIFVATNTEGGGQISDPLPSRIIERFYASTRKPPAAPSLDIAEANRIYAGQYLSTRRRYNGIEGFVLRLQSTMPVSVSPEGYLLAGVGGQTRRLVPAGQPDLFRPAEGPEAAPGDVLFQRDGGRATRIALAPIAFERVGWLYHTNTLILAAALALVASTAVVIGFFLRLGRRLPASREQNVAGRIQLTAAALWLFGVGLFAAWGASVADIVNVFYRWPGPLILTASSSGFASAILTSVLVLLLPSVWRDNLQDEGWPLWRKIRFTLVVFVFGAFGIVLGAWGALQPWAT